MGETYFGVKACNYPRAIPNLRADKIVGPVILDGLVRFVADRKALLSDGVNVGESGE
ncbi:hypothetical protein KL867_17635 [Ruegeria litorea]|uniref:Uncharacterized protein n=1 Tax=Falsiruegeria litorea TaxID=1280831 RepID=A0ABS5WUS9_9RHOB|nr:hypothetical protein [Falsiruegeria litorea]MBT3142894.1 hypothetical protein [Falsiruegeria litorea]